MIVPTPALKTIISFPKLSVEEPAFKDRQDIFRRYFILPPVFSLHPLHILRTKKDIGKRWERAFCLLVLGSVSEKLSLLQVVMSVLSIGMFSLQPVKR